MSYRYGHLASHAIESVLCQTKPADEIVVVDDGAKDFPKQPIYRGVDYVMRHKNLGIVKNFNTTLNQVTTDRVLFLGADNWLHPKTLELLSESDADIITYDTYMVGPWVMGDRAQYEQDGYPVQQMNGTPHGSSLYNVKLAREVGGYEASGNEKSEEDSVLFGRMIEAGARVDYLQRPLLYYRKHEANFQR